MPTASHRLMLRATGGVVFVDALYQQCRFQLSAVCIHPDGSATYMQAGLWVCETKGGASHERKDNLYGFLGGVAPRLTDTGNVIPAKPDEEGMLYLLHMWQAKDGKSFKCKAGDQKPKPLIQKIDKIDNVVRRATRQESACMVEYMQSKYHFAFSLLNNEHEGYHLLKKYPIQDIAVFLQSADLCKSLIASQVMVKYLAKMNNAQYKYYSNHADAIAKNEASFKAHSILLSKIFEKDINLDIIPIDFVARRRDNKGSASTDDKPTTPDRNGVLHAAHVPPPPCVHHVPGCAVGKQKSKHTHHSPDTIEGQAAKQAKEEPVEPTSPMQVSPAVVEEMADAPSDAPRTIHSAKRLDFDITAAMGRAPPPPPTPRVAQPPPPPPPTPPPPPPTRRGAAATKIHDLQPLTASGVGVMKDFIAIEEVKKREAVFMRAIDKANAEKEAAEKVDKKTINAVTAEVAKLNEKLEKVEVKHKAALAKEREGVKKAKEAAATEKLASKTLKSQISGLKTETTQLRRQGARVDEAEAALERLRAESATLRQKLAAANAQPAEAQQLQAQLRQACADRDAKNASLTLLQTQLAEERAIRANKKESNAKHVAHVQIIAMKQTQDSQLECMRLIASMQGIGGARPHQHQPSCFQQPPIVSCYQPPTAPSWVTTASCCAGPTARPASTMAPPTPAAALPPHLAAAAATSSGLPFYTGLSAQDLSNFLQDPNPFAGM